MSEVPTIFDEPFAFRSVPSVTTNGTSIATTRSWPQVNGAPSSTWSLRCLVTGNPFGTDTWRQGYSCPCANCQTGLRVGHTTPA